MTNLDYSDTRLPDSHYQLLTDTLPSWLGNACADKRQALAATQPQQLPGSAVQRAALARLTGAHWEAQNSVDQALQHLQDAKAFARPILEQALKADYGLDLNVEATYLRLYIPDHTPWFPIRSGAARTWTVSLLDAALHNFEHKETLADAYEPASTFITQPSASGQFDTLPQIKRVLSIQAFASLCRDLDMGARYARYLNDELGMSNPVAAAVLRLKVDASQKAALHAAVQLARIKDDISDDYADLIERLIAGTPNLRLNGQPLRCQELRMMDIALTGIQLFSPDLERPRSPQRLVVYVPDDPQHPLKEYASPLAFKQELTRQLRERDYQTFFSRFVPHAQRGVFFSGLSQRLARITWHPPVAGSDQSPWRSTPIEDPKLQFDAQPVWGDPWLHLYRRKLDKILNDARTLAVSTASVDREARWRLWDSFVDVASSILNAALMVVAPFVPGLGELMLGYMAYQLLNDVFEGVIDWAEGLGKEAFGHLMSVLESLVQMGAFAAGTQIGPTELRKVLPENVLAYIDNFKPVSLANGAKRYWKPDLAPYEYPSSLPARLGINELGLHEVRKETILPLENKLYNVEESPDGGFYYIKHPSRPDAYRPIVRHNGAGAWHTELEQPLQWDKHTLLRRLGHSVQDLSEADRELALHISGVDEGVVRKMHVNSEPVSPLLDDTLSRLRIDRSIQRLIDQLRSDDPAVYHQIDPQDTLQLLTTHGPWPRTKALRIINDKGQTAWEFGDKNVPVIEVYESQLENGDLLKTVLRGLSSEEIRAQFSERASDPELSLENRSRLLRHNLADIAERQCSALFESRYATLPVAEPSVQQLLTTTPQLPASVAQALVNQASGAELEALHERNTPPRLAELARTALNEVRLNRAYEGQHLNAPPSLDTDRLALNSLRTLPGWSGEVQLEARHHSLTGPTWLRIGPDDAPIQRTLVRTEAGRYQPHNEQGALWSETDLYSAVLSALPDRQRDQLGLGIHDGAQLKQRLRQAPLPRSELRTLLTPESKPESVTETLRLLGSDNGYRARAPAPLGPTNLLDRAHNLYPRLGEQQLITLVNHLHSQPGGAPAGLAALSIEYSQLERDLNAWQRNIPLQDPGNGPLLSSRQRLYEQRNRERIARELKRCWRRESSVDDYFEDPTRDGYRLNLHYPIRGELPRLSANFDHVSMLTLSGSNHTQGAAAFLGHFPRLRHLTVDGIPLGNLPAAVPQMRGLNVLSLSDCAIALTPHSQAQLASMTQLQTLDLHRNPLGRVPSVEAMTELNTLDLSETGIDRLPPGLLTRNDLSAAFVSGNQIRELPQPLFDLPSHISVAFDLSDNPLSSATLERVKAYYQQHGTYWEADAPAVDTRDAKMLYPSLDANQINQFIYSLPGDLEAGKRELARLAGELDTLQSELKHWAQQPQLPPPEVTRRSELSALLERSWRRDPRHQDTQFVHTLEIPATLAGELPTLSARFKHVGSLTIKGNGSPMGSTAFIDSFPALSILDIKNVTLGDIPAQVFNQQALSILGLPRCSIELSPASVAGLQGMTHLEYLNLDHNPLARTPDFSHLPNLSTISLKDTGLTQVPPSLLGDPPRQSVNLSKNAIEELPETLFSMPASTTSGLDLSANPLTPQTLESIKRYCQRTGESFAAQASESQRIRTQRLYPSFLDNEADRFIFRLPGDMAAIEPTLARLEAEYERLSNDLQVWVQAVPDRHPILDVPIDEQTRAQDQLRRRNFKTLLEQAWRREAPEDEESLDDELTHQVLLDTPILGDLPELNANFDHVTSFQLDGNGTTTGVDGTLRSLIHLQTLKLSKCSLGTLPKAIQRMPKLSTLEITECAIRLTPETRGVLTGATELEFVNLSNNPLGHAPDVSSLNQLAALYLSNAALSEVPEGVFGLDQLQTLDLSDNAIREIPQDLLETSATFNGDSDLSGNPLSAQSIERLRQYYQRTGVDFQVTAATLDSQGRALVVGLPVPDED